MIIGYQMLPDIPTKEALAATNSEDSSDDCYVFISYARPNVEVAKQVGTAFDAANISYFQDINNIGPGDMWSQKIEAALRKANHMVLLLSNASMPYRKEVEREWFYFDMRGKPIYTMLIEDCDINSRLIQVNYIDARSDVNGAVQQLVTKLNQECKNT
ncbi:MAG: toll/interleukin-1 receptor domain-containing protein [Anaerolineae bacterium]|nr:toll/interleukin-1 receptor domain-containing protein [Anaerolineae bacterium]